MGRACGDDDPSLRESRPSHEPVRRDVRSPKQRGPRSRALTNLPPVAALVVACYQQAPSSLLRRDSASFAQLGPVS